MKQRKPGDYVVNAELTDEQRERFVADCAAAGACKEPDLNDYPVTWLSYAFTVAGKLNCWLEVGHRYKKNVTHEYKGKTMTAQSELMHAIGNAMERNLEGWWKEFQLWSCDTGKAGAWVNCYARTAIWVNVLNGNFDAVRPKPCTYTLHIEDMPEPLREEPLVGADYYWISLSYAGPCVVADSWSDNTSSRTRLRAGLCYPDEQTAREALEKLTKAMGGEE